MPDIPAARKDGRPQYYDIIASDRCQCCTCLENGITAQYFRGEGVFCDPANSPYDDGMVYTMCINHLPDDAVIHDPVENKTRTKDGQNVWHEPDDTTGLQPEKIDAKKA